MHISDYTYYLIINIIIILYLLICFTWSLSNQNNILQKLIALPLVKNNILYFGLWHSWNMFVNPTRMNTVLYASITLRNGKDELVTVFDPTQNIFIDDDMTIHDKKYIEHVINDNNIRSCFIEFLFQYYNIKYDFQISKILLIHNFKMIPDFFTKINTNEQAQTIAEWPK